MIKKNWIVYIGLLGLLASGCTIKTETPPEGEQVQQPLGEVVEPPQVEFEEPTQPQMPGVNVSGLIPQTPPNNVNVVVGRDDPFALMPVQPIISIDPEKVKETQKQQAETAIPKVPPIPTPPQGAQKRPEVITPAPTQQGQKPGTGTTQPTGDQTARELPLLTPDGREFSPTLPALPDPALAREVSVTGVIDVAGVPQVILQAPGEPSSRYVKTGDYLSGGQVLVKRIEMNRGSVPVVVLEQFGIEVTREVGQPVELAPEKPETPTASLPSFDPNS
jgi:hypothetical protein